MTDLDSLPRERPEIDGPGHAAWGFCWSSLVAASVHPVKVGIVEALLWINAPLSGTQLTELFGHDDYNLDMILYHLKGLVRLGVIRVSATRHVRGAREKFYFFR